VTGFHHYLLGQFEDAFGMMGKAEALWRALQDPSLDPSWSTGYFHASLGGLGARDRGVQRRA